LNFLDRHSEKAQGSNSIKLHPVGAELFHAVGQIDRHTAGHDEANGRFQNFANVPKNANRNRRNNNTIKHSSSSSSGSTTSIIECFGLPNYFFPFVSVLDAVLPIIYFHGIQIIFDII
jgi:hypothetical protein